MLSAVRFVQFSKLKRRSVGVTYVFNYYYRLHRFNYQGTGTLCLQTLAIVFHMWIECDYFLPIKLHTGYEKHDGQYLSQMTMKEQRNLFFETKSFAKSFVCWFAQGYVIIM